jgi:hypothetical protein
MKTVVHHIKENLLGCLGAALVLVGYYLNANEMFSCWAVWILGNSLVGAHCMQKKVYSTAVISFCLVVMNIHGYYKW